MIGTGEIWRIEFGQIIKCYRPIQEASKIKGLMHAVLGTHGAWGLLRRKNGRENARQNAAELEEALAEAIESASIELPAEMALPAKVVLAELHRLAGRWSSGAAATADDFPSAIERCRPQLEEVIKATGDAVYAALLDGFHAFKNESTAERWRNCFVGSLQGVRILPGPPLLSPATPAIFPWNTLAFRKDVSRRVLRSIVHQYT